MRIQTSYGWPLHWCTSCSSFDAGAYSHSSELALNDHCGQHTFYVTVSVTYTAAALQLPFSDPAGALLGTVTLRSTLSGASFPGSATVVAYGPGFVTYNFYPAQPLPIGSYTVSATYTAGVNYILGSTAGTPTTFLVLMVMHLQDQGTAGL